MLELITINHFKQKKNIYIKNSFTLFSLIIDFILKMYNYVYDDSYFKYLRNGKNKSILKNK